MQNSDLVRSKQSKSKQELLEELENLYAHIEECGLCDIPSVEISFSRILLQDTRSQGVIMDLALDAIVIADESGNVVTLNRSAEAMFGYQRKAVEGQQLADLIIPPYLRNQHHAGFDRYVQTGESNIIDKRVEVTAMRADGEEFPVELTVTTFNARGVRFFTAFIRDISDRVEMEKRIRQEKDLVQLLHRLTSLANEASTTLVAMKGFLREVCEYTGWPVGHVYQVDESSPCARLISSGCWFLADSERYKAFYEKTTDSIFNIGEGIPGRVLATGEPLWVEDLSQDGNFPRAEISLQLGLRTSFALPVIVGQEVVAVMEFFTPKRTRNDGTFIDALTHIGIELGRVIERDQSAEKLRYHADHDVLTGLPNLRVGRDRLNQAVLAGSRQNKRFALLYVDLDGFKQINDSEGHDSGDKVLRVVADRMSRSLRGMDTVARIGGDEFLVLLPDIESRSDVANVATKLIDVISQEISLPEKSVQIGASIGIAIFPDDAHSAVDLSRCADRAMYGVKEKGKNSYRFYGDVKPTADRPV